MSVPPAQVGVVVIGRNEGQHLMRALASVGPQAGATVYADSESTDDSVALAREHHPSVEVVQLRAADYPLSPSRGRNEGYAALRRMLPDVRYVQFLDGDCELHPGWLQHAVDYLEANPKVAVVAGRLRERQRDRNVYHRLADMEWDQPPGEVNDMGGIMMVRMSAWDQVGGQNPDIPAAEEREFCWRVIEAGYKVMRSAADMAEHDIDMASLAEWWTRSVRSGHAYAQGYWVHRDRWHLRHVLSLLTYGAALPGAAVGGAPLTLGLSLSLLTAYPRLWKKIERERLERGDAPDDARLFAVAGVAGKVAGAMGVVRFFTRTLAAGRGGRR
ncbi:MAG: glycosyltransferase [Deltaproteobacteria bacterium]|nr:glycosyltransferase [Deltaproteobacteria bacterium]